MSGPSRIRTWGWYYGWNVVAITVVAQIAANGITLNSLSLFLHDLSADLHAPISSLQLAIVPMLLMSAVCSPLAGGLADRFPARWLMAIGLLGIAALCLLMSMITSLWQYYMLYGTLLPIAVSLSTTVVSNAVVSRWFVRRIGLALGLTAFGVGLSGVLLPPIIAWALPTAGWRAIWRVAGILIAFVVTPLVAIVLRDRPTGEEGAYYLSGQADAARPHGHAAPRTGSSSLRWRDILARRNFWLLGAVYLPIIAIYGGCMQNIAPIAASRGLPEQTAGTLLSILSLFHIASTLVLGLVSDRFGNRLPLAGLALLMAGAASLAAFSGSTPGMMTAAALVGTGGGMWTLLAAAVALEFGAAGFGRAFGLLMALLPIDALVPFATARSREVTGSYAPALLTLAALSVAGGLVCLMLRERRATKPDDVAAAVAVP